MILINSPNNQKQNKCCSLKNIARFQKAALSIYHWLSWCQVVLNPSWTGLPELRQGLGGQICLNIIKFHNKVENHIFQSLQLFALYQNNNCQGWSWKRKVSQKKVTAEKPWGGRSASTPPPWPSTVNNRVLSFVKLSVEVSSNSSFWVLMIFYNYIFFKTFSKLDFFSPSVFEFLSLSVFEFLSLSKFELLTFVTILLEFFQNC